MDFILPITVNQTPGPGNMRTNTQTNQSMTDQVVQVTTIMKTTETLVETFVEEVEAVAGCCTVVMVVMVVTIEVVEGVKMIITTIAEGKGVTPGVAKIDVTIVRVIRTGLSTEAVERQSKPLRLEIILQ